MTAFDIRYVEYHIVVETMIYGISYCCGNHNFFLGFPGTDFFFFVTMYKSLLSRLLHASIIFRDDFTNLKFIRDVIKII